MGTITRAISGTYTVRTDKHGGVVCKPRGRFRRDGITPLVGDRVRIDGSTIIEILPRRNAFVRPPVSNIDALVLLASPFSPSPDPLMLDTLIAFAAAQNSTPPIEPIIVFTKQDLNGASDAVASLADTYRNAGFAVFKVSAVTNEGIDALRCALFGKICVFAGNTGVGKSSLLNALSPSLALQTGDISAKLGRGKHTTRVTEMFSIIDNGQLTIDNSCNANHSTENAADTVQLSIINYQLSIIDTSGFGVSDFDVTLDCDIAACFKEFAPFIGRCRFDDCRHINEPDCAVRAAVGSTIAQSRYDSYVKLCAIMDERKRTQYK